MDFFDRIKRADENISVLTCVALDKFTTFRVGGAADYFAEPRDDKQLATLMQTAAETEIPVLVVGNGSNLLVRDGGFRGLVIHLGKAFSTIERQEEGFYAQAGALLSTLARQAQEASLTGLEFAQGIPGSVGGGVYMNAGAYGGELGQLIEFVRILDGDTIRDIPAGEMRFSYRHTRAMDEQWIILGAQFRLSPGDPKEIEAAMRDYAARRKEKQPLEFPSAGSFFKRPAGHFAGALIEGAGLKGLTVGGAQVSEKHAGFLINRGGATAFDILKLMCQVQAAVMEKYGVALEPEVRIVGENA